jgi:hypothetical protein
MKLGVAPILGTSGQLETAYHDGPEVHIPPQPYSGLHVNRVYDSKTHNAKYISSVEKEIPRPKDTILGLQRQTFWFILILSIVVIAAAIGGGVGGSLAVQNAR